MDADPASSLAASGRPRKPRVWSVGLESTQALMELWPRPAVSIVMQANIPRMLAHLPHPHVWNAELARFQTGLGHRRNLTARPVHCIRIRLLVAQLLQLALAMPVRQGRMEACASCASQASLRR